MQVPVEVSLIGACTGHRRGQFQLFGKSQSPTVGFPTDSSDTFPSPTSLNRRHRPCPEPRSHAAALLTDFPRHSSRPENTIRLAFTLIRQCGEITGLALHGVRWLGSDVLIIRQQSGSPYDNTSSRTPFLVPRACGTQDAVQQVRTDGYLRLCVPVHSH